MSFSQMQRSLQVMEEDMCFYSGVTGTVESLPMRGVSRHVNNIKSEGTYTNDSPTLIGNNINNESCVAIYNQVFSGFDPSRPTKYSRANISDSVPVLDMDQVKRGFFTVNSAEHNQGSKTSDDFLASLPDPPDVLFNCFSLGDLKGELPAQNKPGVCRLGSEISDDSSLDGGLPASSTVSSTSDGLVTGEDHEDDVYVDGSSSVEPPSMKNFTLNSPRLAQRSNIAIPSTCSEGSPQSTDQVRSSSLDAPLAELESGFVNQTILETATVVEQPSPAATLPLQLQGDGNIVLVQQDAKENERPQSSGMDLKWKPEASGLRQSPTVDLKWMHEPPVLVGDENLSKKLKSSPPSSPTTPTQPTLPALPFMRPNLGSLAMNVNPSNQSCSPAFLSHSSILPNSNQWLQQSSHPSPAVAKFAAPPGTKGPFIENMTHPLALFGANFPAVLNIDTASIENSRPKRRNVKISKDPQSVAARHRRERISDRIRVLQRLVPGGTKMDTASMLDEAISYVKYLKLQVQTLESCGNAGYDPRMPFPAYYLPVRPVQGDCSTMSQMAPSAAADHGMYGAGLGQSTMKFPDAYREQFCH